MSSEFVTGFFPIRTTDSCIIKLNFNGCCVQKQRFDHGLQKQLTALH